MRGAIIHLAVYDVLGREVSVLAEGLRLAGRYSEVFTAQQLSSGVYFVSLDVLGEERVVQKMLLVK